MASFKAKRIFFTTCLFFNYYLITFTLSKYDVSQSSLVFTLGILAPLLIAIGQGLPIDCLDMESSLLKELKTK